MIDVMHLAPGTRLLLSDNATAEVVHNPRDGIWIKVRYVTAPGDPAQVGNEALVFAEDIAELA